MGWHDMANRMLGVAVRTFSAPGVELIPGGSGTPVVLASAVFDSSHIEVDPETGAPVSSNNPVLGVRMSDLPAPPIPGSDLIRVSGLTGGMAWANGTYKINDAQPDGVAGATLYLKRTAA